MNKPEKADTTPEASRKGIKVNATWIIVFAILLLGVGFWAGHWIFHNYVDDVNVAKKPGSIEKLGLTEIDEEDVTLFLYSRMATVTTGPNAPKVEYGDYIIRNLKSKNGVGLATAISADGYFLTAAHCIAKDGDQSLDPIIWINGLTTKEPYITQATAVWMSEEQDLAILRTSVELSRWFTVAESFPEVGTKIIAGGLMAGPGGGKVLALNQISSETASHVRLEHNAPTISGDSGGALITLNGRLIGINYKTVGEASLSLLPKSKFYATLIRRDWLHKLIKEDRAKHVNTAISNVKAH